MIRSALDGRVLPRTPSALEPFGRTTMEKHRVIPIMLGLLVASAGAALATNPHTINPTGQPGQTIGTPDTGSATPGHASTAPRVSLQSRWERGNTLRRRAAAELQQSEKRIPIRRCRLPAIPQPLNDGYSLQTKARKPKAAGSRRSITPAYSPE